MANEDKSNEQGTNTTNGAVGVGTVGNRPAGGTGALVDDSVVDASGETDQEFDDEDAPFELKDAGFGEDYQEAQITTEKAVLRLADAAAKGEEAIAQARLEPDLVKRIKAIRQVGGLDFPEVKTVNTGGMQVTRPITSDMNVYTALDALFGSELPMRPHFDTFRGRTVGHNGLPVDGDFPMRDILSAMSAVQLEGIGIDNLRKTYRNWVGEKKMNDLTYKFESSIPEWDGEKRLTTYLVDIIKCHATVLNGKFSKYFWLSLYNRIIKPGCFAPMVLSLFGTQGCGKSYLSKLICEELLGPGANAVELDLAAIGSGQFIRQITGASVIANIGEMAGFTKGDVNKIKAFITKDTDSLDWKYEAHRQQARQWVIVMDGNKYEGLQRDDSGNRRFYPMFCGQLKDKNGQPDWADDFSIDYTGFSESFWQLMAECRAWMASRKEEGYKTFVDEVIKDVKEFSEYEMKSDRGTIRDDVLDMYLPTVLLNAPKVWVDSKRRESGIFVLGMDIMEGFARYKERPKVIGSHLKAKIAALGGEDDMWKNKRGYYFKGYSSIDDMHDRLLGKGHYAGEDAEDSVSSEFVGVVHDDNGGF
jgi:hypothetical protein